MAYRLNRKLILEKPDDVPDGAGGLTRTWVPAGTIWAHIRNRSGGEVAGTAGPISHLEFQIILRAAPPDSPARPLASHRFREGTRIFAILSVTEEGADGRYLLCTAHEEVIA